MQIIYKTLTELKKYKNNPRKNEKAIDKVAASIKEFGFKNPIIIDKDNEIVCGHTRYEAANKLGMVEVPCIMADDLTAEQVKAFRIIDNKTNEYAEWDFDKLNLELSELDFDVSEFGFNVISDMQDINEDDEPRLNMGAILDVDGEKVIMTDDECGLIKEKLKEYISDNGVSFGFVRWLLNG